MKYLLSVIILLISVPAYASLPTIRTYYQHGERTTEYIIEKDDDLDYSFNKYYISLDEELSKRLSFMLNYVDYRREYKEETDMNNRIRDYKSAWDYYFFKDKEKSLKLDFNLGYREKDYENKEKLDFEKTKVDSQLTYRDKENWWGAIRAGIDYYNFTNDKTKDRYIYSEGITVKKYFDDEHLTLIGAVRLKQVDLKEKNDRDEYELELGTDIKTDYNILEKISLRWLLGERNTIEDEEYEEDLDYDYRYKSARVKTTHKLTETLETSIRGEIKEKNYDNVDYDYNSYLLGNEWSWKYFLTRKRKKYIQIGLDLVHGQTDYDIMENSSHYKNGITIALAYKMWGRWSYEIEFGASGYRYELEEKDRDVYHTGAAINRKFFDNKFEINLEYDYRIKDYLSSYKRNVYQHSFLIGGVFKF